MTETRTLFHKSDPETSYEAADRMVKSGALSRQEEIVLNAIKSHLYWEAEVSQKEGFTAKEVNYSRGINYYTIQRRLSGLHNKGKIERIKVGETAIGKPIFAKRDGCCVWRLTNDIRTEWQEIRNETVQRLDKRRQGGEGLVLRS